MRKLFPYSYLSCCIAALGCIIFFADCKKKSDAPASAGTPSVFDSLTKNTGKWTFSGVASLPTDTVVVADTFTITASSDTTAPITITGGTLTFPGDTIRFEGSIPFRGHQQSNHVLTYWTASATPNGVTSGENRILYYYYLENRFVCAYSRRSASTYVSVNLSCLKKL